MANLKATESELSSQFYAKLDYAFESIDAGDYSEIDTIEDLISLLDEQIKFLAHL